MGIVVGISLFYNENLFKPAYHLEWNIALRNWNPGGNSSLRQCLYYVYPTSESSSRHKAIFCIRLEE